MICEFLGVETFLDAPCGDMNWMAEAVLPVSHYIGIDVVPELIATNVKKFGGSGREFLVRDITSEALPQADLIMSRDCLVHLTEELAFNALRQFKAASPYLLATTFYSLTTNLKGSNGGWRPINLQIEPFNLPAPLLIIPERRFGVGQYSDKAMGLWDLKALEI